MKSANWLACAVAVALLAGCESRREVGRQTPAPAPATPSALTARATEPATTSTSSTQAASEAAVVSAATQPASSQLSIDGKLVLFPPARLRVGRAGQNVVAHLYSDDPKAALKDDYVGNHYELMMKLDDATDPHQVYMASWQFKSASRDYVNEPYGIFLEGMKYQLQPLDVRARFLGDMLAVRIDLEGQFLMFDSAHKIDAPKTVYVKGSLLAPIEYKD